MKNFRHLPGVTTLALNDMICIGCGECAMVCPQGVLTLKNKKAWVLDRDGCMECGACATNCPTGAVQVTPGVGCAEYLIKSWIKKRTGWGKATACC